MKTKKLNLNDLKVESFVTSLEGKDAETVKGGGVGILDASLAISVLVTFIAVVAVASMVLEENFTNKGDATDNKKVSDKCSK